MPRKAPIAYRNKNQTGWWLFGEVAQWVSDRQKKLTPRSRCPVHENLRLIRARSREEAYRKAVRLGRSGFPSRTHGGKWRFVGISMLLPVYEPLEDGSEILWQDRGEMSVARIRAMVKAKKELSVFDDHEPLNQA
jgi:hypothetical protein